MLYNDKDSEVCDMAQELSDMFEQLLAAQISTLHVVGPDRESVCSLCMVCMLCIMSEDRSTELSASGSSLKEHRKVVETSRCSMCLVFPLHLSILCLAPYPHRLFSSVIVALPLHLTSTVSRSFPADDPENVLAQDIASVPSADALEDRRQVRCAHTSTVCSIAMSLPGHLLSSRPLAFAREVVCR